MRNFVCPNCGEDDIRKYEGVVQEYFVERLDIDDEGNPRMAAGSPLEGRRDPDIEVIFECNRCETRITKDNVKEFIQD
jgi:hypothetical protein